MEFADTALTFRALRRTGLGEPGGGVKLPERVNVPDRFDGNGRPLGPDPALVAYLTACGRERNAQMTLPLDDDRGDE